ncbi:hypothetical protein F511_37817 [Dorcoceras hygrometricum]|uniref:Delphilin-like n=1 Tax=Dorcoceras hygrometricum TaxID=472368 RepID=A0A2Z7BTD0_9LAMI|nr:hypothetical protein F511_37817 [Dorcoceras hygrometricum]
MENSSAYVSTTIGRRSTKKTVLLTSTSSHMFRGNNDACVSATVEILTIKTTVLLTSFHLIVFKGNISAYNILSQTLLSFTMASAFITHSYQINFEFVLMIHDHEGMLNMFKALEASGLRKFLGCESVLYEKELGHFFDTALIQGEDVTGVISGKFVSISQTLFAKVFDLPTEGITNFSEVPKDTLYDARSLFSKEGVQIDVHGKKKYMKHEFRLLNDILAKALTVKAGSFDSVTVERFQMMTAIHYGLKVNWSKGIPTITMGDGVPFPSAKILSMKTVHTYIVTNTTIDARAESEEPGMAKTAVEKKTPKEKKKTSSADEILVDIFAEIVASKKRSDAPIITKKRRTGKSKPSFSQVNLDIVQVAPDVEPLQIVDPTHAVAVVPSPEIVKDADVVAVMSTDEADIIIAKVLEETLELEQGTVHSYSSRKDLSIEMISGASIKLIQIRSYTQLEKIDCQNKNHSYCLKLRRRDWYYLWKNSTHWQRRFQRECTDMETIFASLTKRNLPYNGAGLTAYYCQEFKKDLLPYLDSSTVERRL